MEHSESIKTFAGAFVKAQKVIAGAVKDKTNPHFRSSYADLSSVMDACKDALNGNGISVIQAPVKSEGNTLALETILMHESGEWVSGICLIPLGKADAQGFGSAMTYARRYGLAAMVGVCPEDDDGNAAVGRPAPPLARQPAPVQQRPATKPAAPVDNDPAEQERLAIQIGELLSSVKMPDGWAEKCLKAAGVSSWYDVPTDKLKKCIAAVNAKQKKEAA